MSTMGANVHVMPFAAASVAAIRAFDCASAGIEARGLCERNGKDSAKAVDHIERKEDRDAVRRFLDRGPLERVRAIRAPDADDGSHLPRSNLREIPRGARWPGLQPLGRRHCELSELFLERERGEKRVDETGLARARRSIGDGQRGGAASRCAAGNHGDGCEGEHEISHASTLTVCRGGFKDDATLGAQPVRRLTLLCNELRMGKAVECLHP